MDGTVYDAILLKDLSATYILMFLLSLRIKYNEILHRYHIFKRKFCKLKSKITSPIQFHSFILIQIIFNHW
jgi:hypothetical protein